MGIIVIMYAAAGFYFSMKPRCALCSVVLNLWHALQRVMVYFDNTHLTGQPSYSLAAVCTFYAVDGPTSAPATPCGARPLR
jgi:hypothetical protein